MIAANFVLAAESPGVYYAFQHSDMIGKIIVVFLVLVGSILTWTVMINKALSIWKAVRLSRRFDELFREVGEKNMLSRALIAEAERNSGPVSAIYRAGMDKLLDFYDTAVRNSGRVVHGAPEPCKLSEAQFNVIEAVLEREVSLQLKEQETSIGMLATLVSLSPFCGLFGTVWGVMMAFCGIAAAGKSDFAALAPGVAGALLTTVAGLVVAIPSLVGYNLLTSAIRDITVTMDNFTEEFLAALKLSQLKFAENSTPAGREEPRETL